MKTPWHDKKGNLHFPLRATFDRVFIFRIPAPESYDKEKLFDIPDMYKKYYRKGEGIVLSVGPGFRDQKGKMHFLSEHLKPGAKISYDKSVPWNVTVDGLDGEEYNVVICGYKDVYGILEN